MFRSTSEEAPLILLVEDDGNDVLFFERAINKADITVSLRVVVTGQQAVDYLSGAGAYGDREKYPLPFLIFLDINLPGMNGFEVLQWLRDQPFLCDLPVVALAASEQERDKERAAALGVLWYLTKPPNSQELQKVVQSLAYRVS